MQSKLLYGYYDISKIPIPKKQDIMNDARAFQEWVDCEKRTNPDFKIDSTQAFVNSTLIALKRYLMIKHNILEFNKFKVIDLYLNHNPPFVNEEIFEFINSELHNNNIEADEEKFKQMME